MKIGDEVYIHGYVDEIRKDTIIIKNDGGYFGTMSSEIIDKEQEPSLKMADYENEIETLQQWLDNEEHKNKTLWEEITRLQEEIKTLEQDTKTGIALERYKDLQDYFGDEDSIKEFLENQKEFKAWLERVYRSAGKVTELTRKLKALEQVLKTYALDKDALEKMLDKIKAITGEWIVDTWNDKTDNFACECMQKIVDVILKSEE